ncbi:hypothetical protein [Xenorhabdus szentirmaii]|uniref:hypothetical protein n=1 Tax=Xenorhabdus szentirmaii TaxID=290112 RepID=UPI002B40C63F|nr:hypothetical protein [Xenorhabdus sp. 5]
MKIEKGSIERNNMVMKLIPEKVDFRISTTDLETVYTESGGMKLRIDAQKREDIENNHYCEIVINFVSVAELRCTTVNFWEFHYSDFIIENVAGNDGMAFWRKNNYSADPHFYELANSKILEERGKRYDPRNGLNLKHYLIIGYDSYIEVVASKYEYQFLS